MMTIRQIKTFAKRQLKGNLLAAIGAIILTFICSLIWATAFVATVAVGIVAPIAGHVMIGPISIDPRMGFMFYAATGIVIAALIFFGFYLYTGLMLGSQKLYINIAKGKRVSAFDIFKGFSNGKHLKHYIGVLFILYLIEFILMIPKSYVGVRYGFNSMDHNITNIITSFLIFVVMLFLCMAGMASADNPDMKAFKAIAVSAHLMRNRKFKLIGLELSFIGWFLLGIITGGLAFFWVIPYFNTAYTIFYLSAYGQDYQSRIQDADYKEASPKDTYVRGDARPASEEPRKSFEEARSQYTDIKEETVKQDPGSVDSREAEKETHESEVEAAASEGTVAETSDKVSEDNAVETEVSDVDNIEDSAEVSGDTELKKSYKSEEDAFAAYEKWKKDHGITIENQDPFHNIYQKNNETGDVENK